MRKNTFFLALFCVCTLSFTACKDAEKDAKEAASAYCKAREIERSMIKSTSQEKTRVALNKKVMDIQKRHWSKTTRKLDPKFQEAFNKYRAECK